MVAPRLPTGFVRAQLAHSLRAADKRPLAELEVHLDELVSEDGGRNSQHMAAETIPLPCFDDSTLSDRRIEHGLMPNDRIPRPARELLLKGWLPESRTSRRS